MDCSRMGFPKITNTDEFFEKLPKKAFEKICDDLKPVDFFIYGMEFDRFKRAAEERNVFDSATIEIIIGRSVDEIFVTFLNEENVNFTINFDATPSDEEAPVVDLTEEPKFYRRDGDEDYSTHLHYYADHDKCYRGTVDKMMRLVDELFPHSYNDIIFDDHLDFVTPRNLEFPFYLVNSLPPGTGHLFYWMYHDIPINFAEINKILSRISFVCSIHMDPPMIDTHSNSYNMNLNVFNVISFSSAEFLNFYYMRNIQFETGYFGENRLGVREYNIFFIRWKDCERNEKLKLVQFEIKNIWNLPGILEGLDAKFYHHTEKIEDFEQFYNEENIGVESWATVENVNGTTGKVTLKRRLLIFECDH